MRFSLKTMVFPLFRHGLALCLGTWLALPAVAATAAASANPAPAPAAAASAPMSKGEIKAIREFHMLDFNGDGKLSRKDVAIVPRLSAAFDDADTNHDGFVTLDEVRAYAVKYRAERDRAKAKAAPAGAAPAAAEPKSAKP